MLNNAAIMFVIKQIAEIVDGLLLFGLGIVKPGP